MGNPVYAQSYSRNTCSGERETLRQHGCGDAACPRRKKRSRDLAMGNWRGRGAIHAVHAARWSHACVTGRGWKLCLRWQRQTVISMPWTQPQERVCGNAISKSPWLPLLAISGNGLWIGGCDGFIYAFSAS